MTTRSESKLPEILPERPCETSDLDRDYVGEGREYQGHNGACLNCGATYSEAEDSDLATAHWMHWRAVERAIWERDTDPKVIELAKVLDPEAPMDATEHAENYLKAERVTAATIARDLVAFAQVAMPDSYWHTDRRIARACAALGITPDQAREMEIDDE